MLPSAVFDFVVGDLEGGERVTEDPRDPGGLTKWGVSQRAFPSLDIRALSRDQAMALYDEHYWRRCRCDELPARLALMVFDTAVNQGTGKAARLLQRAVGVSADGVLGPVTMAEVRKQDALDVTERLALLRVEAYFGNGNPAFLKGWINRVIRVQARAGR